MKYIIIIMDGAAGWPLPERNNRTCLELANTPNLDAMVRGGRIGLSRTVPAGMEPSSACACMSVLGYDPVTYYRGRSAIEAKSMKVPIAPGETVFRCNLVAIKNGNMWSYSSGYISTGEASELIDALNQGLGSDSIRFYPGVSYRHILKISGHEETLNAVCTPPHDISDRPVAGYLPRGPGSELLRDLMERSETVLRDHPVNKARIARGEIPANSIWLFWGSGQIPEMPPFQKLFGAKAAMTSAVDLLRGLAIIADIDILEIPGITDSLDNDFAGQATGALKALENHDLVVVHIEAPDEAGHAGSVENKVKAVELIDRDVIGRVRSWSEDKLRVLVMPDHPTPVKTRTHNGDPVPFLLWGQGFAHNGGQRFTEKDAEYAKILIDNGFDLMNHLVINIR